MLIPGCSIVAGQDARRRKEIFMLLGEMPEVPTVSPERYVLLAGNLVVGDQSLGH